jgi:hypothetical protein
MSALAAITADQKMHYFLMIKSRQHNLDILASKYSGDDSALGLINKSSRDLFEIEDDINYLDQAARLRESMRHEDDKHMVDAFFLNTKKRLALDCTWTVKREKTDLNYAVQHDIYDAIKDNKWVISQVCKGMEKY